MEGRTYVNVIYPKFKMGEEDVREVAEPLTYGMYCIASLVNASKQKKHFWITIKIVNY